MNQRYLPYLGMLFAALLLLSNISAQKLTHVSHLTMPASIIIYPILYTFGSLITEVYGKKTAIRITFFSILLNLLMALVFYITIKLPVATAFHQQPAYETILGSTPLFVAASTISFLFGEVSNILLTALLKKSTQLFIQIRTLICNLAGLSIDCFIFILIAFFPLGFDAVFKIALSYYFFKVIYQCLMALIIKPLSNSLKRAEA